MSVIWQSPVGATVTGEGTGRTNDGGPADFQPFGLLVPVLGSSRLANQVFRLHASGTAKQLGVDGGVFFNVYADYPAVVSAQQYPTAKITHVVTAPLAGSHVEYTLTAPGSAFVVGQSITVAGTQQRPQIAITNVELTSNVVTISAQNAYTVGDIVTVAAVTNTAVNGTFVITGEAEANFTYDLTHANIISGPDTGLVFSANQTNGVKTITAVSNSGLSTATVSFVNPTEFFVEIPSHSEVGTVAIGSQLIFNCGALAAVDGQAPWALDVFLQMDSVSGSMQGVGRSLINNTLVSETAINAMIPGVNPANDPPLLLSLSVNFDAPDPSNTATITNLSLLDV